MNIQKELSSKSIVLLIVSSTGYNNTVLNTARVLSKKGTVCYITLNKSYDSLTDTFTKNGVNMKNVVFIDCISKTFKNLGETANGCYFVSSPAALTEISLLVTKFLNHRYDYIIFDSLTNMLIYENQAPILKFVANMVNKIRATKTKAVLYALSAKEQELLIHETTMFVDQVMIIK